MGDGEPQLGWSFWSLQISFDKSKFLSSLTHVKKRRGERGLRRERERGRSVTRSQPTHPSTQIRPGQDLLHRKLTGAWLEICNTPMMGIFGCIPYRPRQWTCSQLRLLENRSPGTGPPKMKILWPLIPIQGLKDAPGPLWINNQNNNNFSWHFFSSRDFKAFHKHLPIPWVAD